MEVSSALVTGSNRGVGLEIVKQLSQLKPPPSVVFATDLDENPTEELKKIQDDSKACEVLYIKMDVRCMKDVVAARKIVEKNLGDEGLGLLVNNAAINCFQSFPNNTSESMIEHFEANAVGPVLVTQELSSLVCRAAELNKERMGGKLSVNRAAIVTISSFVGSITDHLMCPGHFRQPLAYKMSKAAMNMAMRNIALTSLAGTGVFMVNVCPGWVKTRLGGENAHNEVHSSVESILTTLTKLNDSHHGTLIDRLGANIPF